VLDLGFALPLTAVAARRLWVGAPGRVRLAIPLLTFMALLGVTILAMTAWMAADGQAIDPAMPAIFVVVTLVAGALAAVALAPGPARRPSRSVSARGLPSS
jgi:hypothetical protein